MVFQPLLNSETNNPLTIALLCPFCMFQNGCIQLEESTVSAMQAILEGVDDKIKNLVRGCDHPDIENAFNTYITAEIVATI